jgi:prepilin-type N-terminal cleavage/methylation domain-containing protein
LKTRLLKEESGFTLPEVLVAMTIMLTVMFALYAIFDAGIRVFSFGSDKVEAVENARIGLARMEREIRAAYPVDKAANPSLPHLFFASGNPSVPAMPAERRVTFGNDLDGSRKVECPTGSACEYITYKLSADGRTLIRNKTAAGSNTGSGGEPVVEFVDGATGLSFAYLNSNGNAVATEADIAIVRITLRVKVQRTNAQPTTQTLTTDVALRNRGN